MKVRACALVLTAIALTRAFPALAQPAVIARVQLNGQDTGVVAEFRYSDGHLTGPAETLKQLGLRAPAPTGYVDLETLPGLAYILRDETQVLELSAEPQALQPIVLVGRTARQASDVASPGALFNYSASVLGGDGAVDAALYGEARVFGPAGVFSGSFAADTAPTARGLRRYDTAFVMADPERPRRLILGDYVTTGLPWTRPVRAAGLSFASDFASRPDIVTQPLPSIQGAAAAPSTVELFIDGVRRYSAASPAGPFTIRQPPVVGGRGEVSLVVTDPAGRETVQTFAFYASDRLLRAGLTAFALDAGAARLGYGGPDDRYGGGFLSASVQHGLTDTVTVQAHGEFARDLRQAGAGLVMNLAQEALLSSSVSLSSSDRGSGGQVHLSLQREAADLNLFASMEQSIGDFTDLASTEGDPMVRRRLQVSVAKPTTRAGVFGVNYSHLETAGGEQGVLTGTWSRQVATNTGLYMSAYSVTGGGGGHGVSLGLSTSLGRRKTVSVQASADRQGQNLQAYIAQSPPAEGGWGWRAEGRTDGGGGLQGEVRKVDELGERGLGVAWTAQGFAARGFDVGSVVFMGGPPRLAPQVAGALVMVDTGFPDVGVRLENRAMGKTGADGRLLLTNVLPYLPSEVEVVPESVPLDADILLPTIRVQPPRGAGIVVRLPVRKSQAVRLVITASDGTDLPPGSPVRADGKEIGVLGYGSSLYLEQPPTGTALEVIGAWGRCVTSVPVQAWSTSPTPLALTCQIAPLE